MSEIKPELGFYIWQYCLGFLFVYLDSHFEENPPCMEMECGEYNFDDISPLPIGDEAAEVKDIVLCKIMYTDEFKQVFSYLRALMEKEELSRRAMYVACRAISLVPAHYTVWEYKFRIVKELVNKNEYDVLQELEWCSHVSLANEKNYQIWHYREMVIELLINTAYGGEKEKYDLCGEYDIIKQMLARDTKNYHVWSHKRWVVQYFGLFRSGEELQYTETLIDEDVRNNSAWNFRHFILFGDKADAKKNRDTLSHEIGFTISQIARAITNPSSWNYLKFLYGECLQEEFRDLYDEIKKTVLQYTLSASGDEERLPDQGHHRVAVPAFEVLAEMHAHEGDADAQRHVYGLLAEKLDPVRRNYWKYKSSLV